MQIQEWLGLLLGHKVTVLAPCTLVQVSQVTCTLSNVGALASRGAFNETQIIKQQWCRFTTCHLRVGISLGLRQIRRKNAMWQMQTYEAMSAYSIHICSSLSPFKHSILRCDQKSRHTYLQLRSRSLQYLHLFAESKLDFEVCSSFRNIVHLWRTQFPPRSEDSRKATITLAPAMVVWARVSPRTTKFTARTSLCQSQVQVMAKRREPTKRIPRQISQRAPV